MKNELKKLSEEQREAVLATCDSILVSAGPGSGKTVVIVNRVYNLIRNMRVSPRNIIIITFTKAAATHMRKRFLALSGDGSSPFFGTFHGLCYKILKSYYNEINIIESWEAFKVIKSFLSTYMDDVSEDRIKDYINGISISKCGKDIDNSSNSIDKDILMNCITFYESYKKEKGLLDFEDLQIMTRDLFLKNGQILNYYQNQFKHILVDEFQDSDDIQIEILTLLKNENNNIFTVGDEDQCIYSFRGANPIHMVDFKDRFKDGKTLYLSTNYRSRKNIVSLSMKSIKNNRFRTDKHIISNKDDEGIINFKGVPNETIQGDFISDHIIKIKNSSHMNYSDFAVIYRTNMESRSIVDSFIRRKIPFNLLDKQFNFFNHFICQDMLAYLKLSLYPSNMEAFTRIINKPFRYISKSNLEAVKNHIGLNNPFMVLRNLETIPVFQIKLIEKLENDISALNKMSLYTAVEFIIGDLMYHKYLMEYGEKYHMSLVDLENVLNEFKESVNGFKTINEFLNHVAEVEEETQKAIARTNEKKDGVILATIHAVKGMEFDTVYMINAVDGFLPYKDNDLEEERRLFYVGLTRAINNVIFVAPDMIRGEKRVKSQFLRECDLRAEMLGREKFKIGATVNHSFYGEGIIEEMDESNIKIRFKDISRKFDFGVLINNGLLEVIN